MNTERLRTVPKFRSFYQTVAARLGVDRAVRWTLLTQGIRFVTGPITMFLMVHYLTPEIQGYAYTFTSVIALSIFLEMGFSQNILQFASHEFSKLELGKDRELFGDPTALSRLVSLGRLSFKYYSIAAILFFLTLITGGNWFFDTVRTQEVSWAGPWLLACVSSALSLVINPCWALIEGCNQIATLERFRFYNSLAAFAITAMGLIAGFGLYAIVLPSLVSLVISAAYLIIEWRKFFLAFRNRPSGEIISWKKELWPFQWRIAVSWMSGYFIFSIITPIIFRTSGAAAAGRFGFTMQMVRLVSTVASSWTVTKLPLFGMLVARKDWTELNNVWLRVTKITLIIAAAGSVGLIGFMEIAPHFYPRLGERYAGHVVALLLCSTMLCQSLTSSCAYFLRAFKTEPYMVLSVLTALLSFVLISVFSRFWGMNGATIGYAAAIFITAVPAYLLFTRKRSEFILAPQV